MKRNGDVGLVSEGVQKQLLLLLGAGGEHKGEGFSRAGWHLGTAQKLVAPACHQSHTSPDTCCETMEAE